MKHWAYTKGEPSQELYSRQEWEARGEHAIPLQIRTAPNGYIKQDGSVSPRLYLVISGGTTRERKFLGEFLKDDGLFSSLKVIFLTSAQKAGGLTPKMMHCEWTKILTKGEIPYPYGKIILKDIDRIYMITDVDHYEHELRSILHTQDTSCQWIISNPDIEIWLYYCYFNKPQEDLHEVIHCQPSKRSSLMKSINSRLKSGGIDPRKAFSCMKQGIQNAKSNYAEDSDGFPLLLSTQMWKFCQSVYCEIHAEFDNWLREQQRRIQSFKKQSF